MYKYMCEKAIVFALISISVVTVSHAMEKPLPALELFMEPHQRILPTYLKAPAELKITKKSGYNLNVPTVRFAMPSVLSVSSQEAGMKVSGQQLTTAFPPVVRANELPYNFLLFRFRLEEAEMPTVESLYKTYGYNKAVKRSLNYYKKDKKSFSKKLSRATKYADVMIEIFAARGLPPELVYLPLIESGFNPYAYSPKRAAGPWQFIPATAKKYGLKINWWVDERRDPIKSTIAASEYLRNLYERFGNWNLALAAYNAGEGKIIKAIKRVKKSNYWRIRKTGYINKETKNYVPSFIAATAIALEPERFGFNDVEYQEPFEYDVVEIDTPMDLAVVAEFTGVKTSKIRELNPELRRWCTPPDVSKYILRIPAGTKERFLASLYNSSDDELFYVKFHKVKRGDTVSKIARQLGTSIQAIIDVNSLGKKALIIAGKTILVPIDRKYIAKGQTISTGGLKPILRSRNL